MQVEAYVSPFLINHLSSKQSLNCTDAVCLPCLSYFLGAFTSHQLGFVTKLKDSASGIGLDSILP